MDKRAWLLLIALLGNHSLCAIEEKISIQKHFFFKFGWINFVRNAGLMIPIK